MIISEPALNILLETMAHISLLYFAWVRERIGKSEEDIMLPATVGTVGELLDWLAKQEDAYADALIDRERIRIAINQNYAKPDDPISCGDEIAIFPPVTGG